MNNLPSQVQKLRQVRAHLARRWRCIKPGSPKRALVRTEIERLDSLLANLNDGRPGIVSAAIAEMEARA